MATPVSPNSEQNSFQLSGVLFGSPRHKHKKDTTDALDITDTTWTQRTQRTNHGQNGHTTHDGTHNGHNVKVTTGPMQTVDTTRTQQIRT